MAIREFVEKSLGGAPGRHEGLLAIHQSGCGSVEPEQVTPSWQLVQLQATESTSRIAVSASVVKTSARSRGALAASVGADLRAFARSNQRPTCPHLDYPYDGFGE